MNVSFQLEGHNYHNPGLKDKRKQSFVRLKANDEVGRMLEALKECGRSRDISRARRLHSDAIKLGWLSNRYVANNLITAFHKCGTMKQARSVFEEMHGLRDIVSWTCLLQGYVENGEAEVALELFERMEYPPEARTYVVAITACTSLATKRETNSMKWLRRGMSIHSQAVAGRQCNKFVENALIDMYAKCRRMADARRVFDSMSYRQDVISWTALIHGYVENGESQLALEIFERMSSAPNGKTYVSAVSACASLGREWLQKGKAIHDRAVQENLCDSFVENALVDMYARCGDMMEARKVFDSMSNRSVVSWTALLQGYVENGEHQVALELFEAMEEGARPCVPCNRTYAVALTACAGLAASGSLGKVADSREWLERGREIHSRAVKRRCCDEFVQAALVSMYAKCGSMGEARSVFDMMLRQDVVSWTALLQGYVENGERELSLQLFDSMQGCVPNERTYVVAVTACASLGSGEVGTEKWLEKGRAIHARAVKGRCCNMFVETALVNMYAKCGCMGEARGVFDEMVKRNVVSWNCILQGYVDNGESEVALKLADEMDVTWDSTTFVAMLCACGDLMDVERGKQLHRQVKERGYEEDVLVAGSLVHFYGKCGDMEVAREIFDSVPRKGVSIWNSLMCGYSLQGDAGAVLKLFHRMREQGISPSETTFVCVLIACSHAGMTSKGKEYFKAMNSEYGVCPTVRHYACMVDMLGRGNDLYEALKLVRSMPFQPSSVVWCSLLSACQKWNNVDVGKIAYEALVGLDDKRAAAYVLMANAYRGLQSNSSNYKSEGQQDITHLLLYERM